MLSKLEIIKLLHENGENDFLLMEAFKPFILKTCVTHYGGCDDDAIQDAYVVLLNMTKKFRNLLRQGKIKECCYVKYITSAITYSLLNSWNKDIKRIKSSVSLDEVICNEQGGYLFIGEPTKFIVDFIHSIHIENQLVIKQLIQKLNNRERKLITAYYMHGKVTSLRKLAKEYEISPQRLMQILHRAINKMKARL